MLLIYYISDTLSNGRLSVVCLSHARIVKTKLDKAIVTIRSINGKTYQVKTHCKDDVMISLH